MGLFGVTALFDPEAMVEVMGIAVLQTVTRPASHPTSTASCTTQTPRSPPTTLEPIARAGTPGRVEPRR